MMKGQVIGWLVANGWTESPRSRELWRNPKFPDTRYRITRLGLKRECKMDDGMWFRAVSAYYKDLRLVDGRLVGLSTAGMQGRAA